MDADGWSQSAENDLRLLVDKKSWVRCVSLQQAKLITYQKDATKSGWEIIHLYAALSPVLGSPVHNKYHQTGDKTTEMDQGWST